jgi:hypothetical protein
VVGELLQELLADLPGGPEHPDVNRRHMRSRLLQSALKTQNPPAALPHWRVVVLHVR